MNDLGIIDTFTQTFIAYIDQGFGLLGPSVNWLMAVLFVIDLTLAGLFWAMNQEDQILTRFIRKVLYVGAFVFIIGNFSLLADIIFRSFAGLGIQATDSSIAAADLLRPGIIAGKGWEAAFPLLAEINEAFTLGNVLTGALGFNILVLLIAWLLVVFAFFILAIQLLVTIIEFKLTALAGFVLVPFALWRRSAFLAERVIGNIFSSGIKLMALAIIIGIGSTFFDQFTAALNSAEDVEIEGAMVLAFGALALMGLAIFVPAVAAGIVAGGPQLGAGAAIGTAAGVAVGAAGAAGLATGAGRLGAAGISAGVKAASKTAGAATGAYSLNKASTSATGAAAIGAGFSGVARAGTDAVKRGAGNLAGRVAEGPRNAFAEGRRSAEQVRGAAAAGGPAVDAAAASAAEGAPAWATRLRREQQFRRTTHALKDGERPTSPATPDMKEEDE